ncbi:MAG TPA: BTAD domain-containing putative transcriptional regulator, partial [Candidatus Limnocylindrales bacterium]|nr:BTAD domain-containing putative transcriptional regulator [Candidatus Limnocylindrales bacterium]
FETLVRDGRTQLEQRRHARAAASLRAALKLWRGRPFAGLPEDGLLRTESARLDELRLLAFESRVEADLEVGGGAELVDELEALVATNPFRERLWRHLMLALYRAGRQADALAAYHRARSALDEELGIEPGEDLRELEAAILRQEVPQPRSGERMTIGLPVPLTSFVGRAAELEEVRALLQRSRLVTLVGVGGVGKTRLALEAAGIALHDTADALAFVDLAALSDPASLPGQVSASLGLRDAPQASLGESLTERFGASNVLLLLDNCEHLRDATAELAQGLLRSSPDLRILATSREVLGVAGEAPYPVSPLALPGPQEDPGAARSSDAVRLLLDRATLTRHDLRLDEAAFAAAARICQELEGLPLAIELAAARARALSLDEIALRLRDRFQFLVAWRRLSAARHQTLREAMDWSFELLRPDEQQLLARLSVFPAGATLASISAVCLDGDEADAEAERLVERLVDASLLTPVYATTGTRYRLLETVRQYAAERLPAAELLALQRRHADRVRVIAESANLGLESASHDSHFDVARDEVPSIRAAIQWADEHDPAIGVRIATALERFWALTRAREGIAVFDRLLAHEDLPEAPRAAAFRARGGSRYASGDFAGGIGDYERALAIHRRLGQSAHAAHLTMRLAMEAQRVGATARAKQLLDEAARIGANGRFPPDEYAGMALESDLAFDAGRDDEGFELLARAGARAAAAGDIFWHLSSLLTTAERDLARDRVADAGAPALEALRLAQQIEDRQTIVWSLAVLAQVAAASGAQQLAGRLWGGLEAEVERGGHVGQWEGEEATYRERVLALAGDGFDAGVAKGRSMSLGEVLAEAEAGADSTT